MAWLTVWCEVQTSIWPSWCHCHSLSLASVKSRLVLPFWCRLTWVVPEKGLLNGCVCVKFQSGFKWGKRWWGFGMRRHQVDDMLTICTSVQTDNNANSPTPHHSIFTGWVLFLMPNQQCLSFKSKRNPDPVINHIGFRLKFLPPNQQSQSTEGKLWRKWNTKYVFID